MANYRLKTTKMLFADHPGSITLRGTSGKNQQRREYILYFPRLKQAPVVKRDHYIHTVLYPGAPFYPQTPALEMDPDTRYYLCPAVHDQHVLFR
jgi:hypothetical protein